MKAGDLVGVYPRDMERSELVPMYVGMYMGYDEIDDGPEVLIDGSVLTYARIWWDVRRINDAQWRQQIRT